jgi:hypothetical protein
MSRTRFIFSGKNSKGASFALGYSFKQVVNEDRTLTTTTEKLYSVWVLSENYAGHVRGGIVSTWCYLKKDLDFEAAHALYVRRVSK